MKYIFLGLFCLFSFHINGQDMYNIQETITRLFVATDQQDWQTVEQSFSDQVILDYSSMTGQTASELSPRQIVDSWTSILPGFEHTHHQLGNFQIQQANDQAKASCYGTATHYLPDPAGHLWTVVGTYDFDLTKAGTDWRVSSMTFNFKYQTGNTTLPQKAINRLTSTPMPLPTAETNKETVRQFFQALEQEDVEALVDLFAEDAKHINPYHSDLFPTGAEGKEGIRAYWTPVFPNFDGMKFPIEEIYAMEDPQIVYVKFKGEITLKDNVGQYNNDYYSTFKFDEAGKIIEYVEIFNPITAARGFGLLDKIR